MAIIMTNQEKQVKIVLDSLISKFEEYGYIPYIDAEVTALFSFWNDFNLVKQQKRYFALPDSYFAKFKHNREYELAVEYAIQAIENSQKEHYKISKS